MRRLSLIAVFATLGLAVACGAKESGTGGSTDDIAARDLPVTLTKVFAGTMVQEIDHPADGSASTLGTFEQRYFYSRDLAVGDAPPVILNISGESPSNTGEVARAADMARGLGAAIVTLEHRFYGKSQPPQLDGRMSYLTVHNAIEDLASFVRQMKTKDGFGGKWIVTGGSYSGFLAAAFRQAHPELAVGAYASSAPMKFASTYPGYDRIASSSLGADCAALVQKAIAQADAAFDDPAKRTELLKNLYDVPPTAVTPKVKSNALFRLSVNSAAEAQYGRIHNLCASLTQYPDDPLAGMLLTLRRPSLPDGPARATSVGDAGASASESATEPGVIGAGNMPDPSADPVAADTEDDASDASAPDAGSASPAPAAQPNPWEWQICAELGNMVVKNTGSSESVFADDVAEALQSAKCTALTGRPWPPALANVDAYAAPIRAGAVTNIFFTTGTLDPWAGIIFDDPAAMPAGTSLMVMSEGAHCEDMINLKPDSFPAAFTAHIEFNALAKKWLAE